MPPKTLKWPIACNKLNQLVTPENALPNQSYYYEIVNEKQESIKIPLVLKSYVPTTTTPGMTTATKSSQKTNKPEAKNIKLDDDDETNDTSEDDDGAPDDKVDDDDDIRSVIKKRCVSVHFAVDIYGKDGKNGLDYHRLNLSSWHLLWQTFLNLVVGRSRLKKIEPIF